MSVNVSCYVDHRKNRHHKPTAIGHIEETTWSHEVDRGQYKSACFSLLELLQLAFQLHMACCIHML